MNFSRYTDEARQRLLALSLAVRGRSHQLGEISALRRFIRRFDVDCVFDVGANRGQYARMLRKEVGYEGTILSFEPNPRVFRTLGVAAEHDRNWHCFETALSDRNGEQPFNVMKSDQFSSLEQPDASQDALFAEHNKTVETPTVKLQRIDTIFAELRSYYPFSRPYLKLDTQGHDLAALRGAGETIRCFTGVQTELSFRTLYADAPDYRAAIDCLAKLGFTPSALFPNNKGHFPLLVEMDGIFVADRLIDSIRAELEL